MDHGKQLIEARKVIFLNLIVVPLFVVLPVISVENLLTLIIGVVLNVTRYTKIVMSSYCY